MKDDKIVHIGKNKRSLEDELLEIAQLINGEGADDKENDDKSSIYVSGTGNVVGNGNTVSNVINLSSPSKKPRVQVKTGDGVVDANQKHQIKTLIYEWVDIHNAIKKSVITHNAAWIRLNKNMKVNSYHEIKSDDFPKAIKYLRSQIGILRNMASAPKKVTDWRKETIKSIQTRCSKNGWQEWRKTHMSEKFQKSSMTELTDAELQQLYQTVWGKR
ncbi:MULTISPECIES: hypothetical protein [Brenneria]|uniref:Uncharacterized protein n=1 Tax=Brenneria nigrifluens DSM 30175 = ATCC 13028 TaxID=1121120 RepID=A0A2U1USP5_9GAMM|nr:MULTISPECIES: hypothetical protein [Brenneria]EHD21517.1 hypothetical protein BrE312_2134 [Brenneria sp. EniD312]PWC24696.1 hypothetical protein DDT54_08395 [Brenneria nigrifluens DSM 30175 = ATCC 13028]QCR04639.1 hypothetical protein EH206_10930 [Brenneria nigrifluens DSM 30175 = ATCC 13028]